MLIENVCDYNPISQLDAHEDSVKGCPIPAHSHWTQLMPQTLAGRPHVVQRISDALAPLCRWQAIEFGRQAQILIAGQGAVGRHELRHIADAPPDLSRRFGADPNVGDSKV